MPWRKQVVSYLAAFYGSLHICKTSQLASTPHLLLTYKPPLTTVCAGKYLAGEPVSYRMCSTNVTFPAAWSGHVLPVDGLRCSQVVFGFFNCTAQSPWTIFALLQAGSDPNTWRLILCGWYCVVDPKRGRIGNSTNFMLTTRSNESFDALHCFATKSPVFIWKYESHQRHQLSHRT